ncbi:MAG: putative ABC transport system ATP-binding protein [Verrucomicrobia bacterium]|nr:MAG: putative ABC transport system ATP-binding protein [Verrucomicrobiota bacterium]
MADRISLLQTSHVLEVSGLTKIYSDGEGSLTVLNNISLTVSAGETCAIVGPSGSGKTTLLGLCAGLDDPTSGTVLLAGERLEALSQNQRAAVRSRHVGFVFQNFQLIPTLTALENVQVPLELRGEPGAAAAAAAEILLKKVGLGERLTHYPNQLSGGEQQRVALARAFVRPPRILFADEPTGNLDATTSELLVEMLFALNRENGTALVLVTHDLTLAARAGRVVSMHSGRIVADGAPLPTSALLRVGALPGVNAL